jgi:hypothetical protein
MAASVIYALTRILAAHKLPQPSKQADSPIPVPPLRHWSARLYVETHK